jgi:hypothetical protein
MTLDLTDYEAALLLRELNGLIDRDRYFLSDRIKTLKAIRAKIRPESLYRRRRSAMPRRGRVRRGGGANVLCSNASCQALNGCSRMSE